MNTKNGSLVITRLPDRSIQIGKEIIITVLNTNKHTDARLPISTPLEMDIKYISLKYGLKRSH